MDIYHFVIPIECEKRRYAECKSCELIKISLLIKTSGSPEGSLTDLRKI